MSWKAWIYRLGYPCAKAWWFFRRPKTEGIMAIIRRGDSVLLVRHSYRTDAWCFIGGGIDKGESAMEACVREILEETGLQCYHAGEFYTFAWTRENKRDIIHVFVAWVSDGEPVVDGDEILGAEWFHVTGLPNATLDHATLVALREYEQRVAFIARQQRIAETVL